ncbi:hypothetical protein [Streptomyces sp. NPDC005125]
MCADDEGGGPRIPVAETVLQRGFADGAGERDKDGKDARSQQNSEQGSCQEQTVGSDT